MGSILLPGMRLMRRLGITGKFIAIALLLLLPLAVNVAAGWDQASSQIAVAARERQGLLVAAPLVRLLTCLADVETSPAGRIPSRELAAALDAATEAMDAAGPGVVGADARVRWNQAREGARQLAGSATAALRSGAATARGQVLAVIRDVADRSDLRLDPQLDSHYLVAVLVDRLPALVSAIAGTERDRLAVDVPATSLAVGRHAVLVAVDLLDADLASAQSATGSGLASGVGPAAHALDATVSQYSARLSEARASGEVRTVSSSAAALATVLSGDLDARLAARRGRLSHQRTEPLLLTLAAVLAAAYLVAALYRATARDVRVVLTDISTVTNGALNQTPPLAGRDEFAQMSRTLVFARDRLTALLGALRFRATHDELTALGNRALFQEKLDETLAAGRHQVAVVLADLVRFKDVNDSFGHDIGDRLLRTVGARFHRAVGRRNLVARLAADEFAILVTDASSPRDVQHVIAQLRGALADPVDIDGRQFHTRVAIGATVHDGGPASSRDLLRQAAVALSASKAEQRAGDAFYRPAMQDRTRDRTELSADLVAALDQGQFSLLYQPIVDLATGNLRGAEALVRWLHPSRGPLPPTTFVPLAEATGLIVPLGRWVLREAVQQLASWRRDCPDAYPLTLDVNLSADQLEDASLPGELLCLIDETGIDPSRLVLEITESALVRDLDRALRRLGQLSATGVRIALDDFGTGYSSLSVLRDLPVTVLKVDKSFVDGIDDPAGPAARLLSSIVDLGAGQGMEVIAEGVESTEQVESLRRIGCHLGQGYLWSRPLPAEAVADLLRAEQLTSLSQILPGGAPRPRTAEHDHAGEHDHG